MKTPSDYKLTRFAKNTFSRMLENGMVTRGWKLVKPESLPQKAIGLSGERFEIVMGALCVIFAFPENGKTREVAQDLPAQDTVKAKKGGDAQPSAGAGRMNYTEVLSDILKAAGGREAFMEHYRRTQRIPDVIPEKPIAIRVQEMDPEKTTARIQDQFYKDLRRQMQEETPRTEGLVFYALKGRTIPNPDPPQEVPPKPRIVVTGERAREACEFLEKFRAKENQRNHPLDHLYGDIFDKDEESQDFQEKPKTPEVIHPAPEKPRYTLSELLKKTKPHLHSRLYKTEEEAVLVEEDKETK